MIEALKNTAPTPDYAYVRQAIEFISEEWRAQPSIEAVAQHVGLSPSHLHALFQRWAGLSPQAFLHAVTINHARALVGQGAPLLDAALDLGLSGPGRLHDLFIAHEAMSPGEWKRGGDGLTIRYGFHTSPFGSALVMTTPRGLCGLAFADDDEEEAALADMTRRWPNADYIRDDAATAATAHRVFQTNAWKAEQPLKVILIGTDFEIRVWENLLRIPLGAATTYSAIAERIGNPKASRAVGAAVGRNPISFVVPCHRVVGKSGALTGYHWGLTRKRAMLGWEVGQSI